MFSISSNCCIKLWRNWITSRKSSSIKPFINKYNWEWINYPSKIDDGKTFETNNPTIALNILYIREKEICPAYISKINSNCKKKNYSINDSKRRKRRTVLSCSKKTVYIIKRNNIKAWWFLLIELSSFF